MPLEHRRWARRAHRCVHNSYTIVLFVVSFFTRPLFLQVLPAVLRPKQHHVQSAEPLCVSLLRSHTDFLYFSVPLFSVLSGLTSVPTWLAALHLSSGTSVYSPTLLTKLQRAMRVIDYEITYLSSPCFVFHVSARTHAYCITSMWAHLPDLALLCQASYAVRMPGAFAAINHNLFTGSSPRSTL